MTRQLREARVGGAFWRPPADLPEGHDVVLCPSGPAACADLLAAVQMAGLTDRAVVVGRFAGMTDMATTSPHCDPWDLCDKAAWIFADANNEIALVARLLGRNLAVTGQGRYAKLQDPRALDEVIQHHLCATCEYRNPFDGRPMPIGQAIALLDRWRALIHGNRKVKTIFGVALWKRVTADALLWDGSGGVRHSRSGPMAARRSPIRRGETVLAWVARTGEARLADLAARGATVGEIEDGMIRSNGLGANCVPPLSLVVDFAGPHFDPARPSTLETILQTAEIDATLLARASALRARLIAGGISKYGRDGDRDPSSQARAGRRLVLVTGQVEDDRSMLCGGDGVGNLELLRRARACEPDALIIFRPHPDVEAGHRRGCVPDNRALEHADEIDRSSSIVALLDRVDAVHIVTSLAGFEALMRGRQVVTHGVPFYAGWGLTRDLGPVPPRRSRRRSLDELVAATLLLYPRYIDPLTRLPCEAETLVDRIEGGEADVRSLLVLLREVQGRLKRVMRRMR